MFTPPRFVVIDDKPEHLKAILDVFQMLGTPCQGVAYDPEHELDSRYFKGVRCLFVDLHLTDLAETTDERRHYAIIADILQEKISPTGGPFILVVWTEHDDSVAHLKRYLDESLVPERRHAYPLAVVSLPKTPFIDLDTGAPNEGRADALRDAVERAVREQPQLAALVAWETDVQAAMGATLSALVDLVPDDLRNSTSVAAGLQEILSRLAREAVGQSHVTTDPRAAITSALAPILADRIVNQRTEEADAEVWEIALAANAQGAADPEASGKINRMLHLAVPTSEAILPTTWGAVVEFPEELWNDDELNDLFGITRRGLLDDEFKIDPEDHEQCRRRLIRIGAACDYAQNRSGPISYLFGIESRPGKKRKSRPQSVWESPTLVISQEDEPFLLLVNARYPLSVPAHGAETWQPVYRLREQLLMHLISHASGYMARPGIVQF